MVKFSFKNLNLRLKFFYIVLALGSSIFLLTLVFLATYHVTTAHHIQRIQQLHELERGVTLAQYQFKRQVQEWKNILLRGNDLQDFKTYYRLFEEEHEKVQQHVNELLSNDMLQPMLRQQLMEFRNQHQFLFEQYLSAIADFSNDRSNPFAADQLVRGIDRLPTIQLEQAATDVEATASELKQVAETELSQIGGFFAFVFILSQAILVTMLFKISSNLYRMSVTDATSGLGSKSAFLNEVQRYLTDREPVMFAILDFDDFKLLNESFGVYGGDRYLQSMGQKLASFAAGDTQLYRLNGDEIGIIFRRLDASGAKKALTDLISVMKQYEFRWQGRHGISLTASTGCYCYDGNPSVTIEEVINRLYSCTHQAKANGKDTIVYDEGGKELSANRQIQATNQLKSALRENHVVLFRQAIFKPDSLDCPNHFECLLRIKTADQSYLLTKDMLIAAERYHLITALDLHVLELLLSYLADTPSDTSEYSFNLSGKTIADDTLQERMGKLLANYPVVDLKRLCIEVTETALMENPEVALANVDWMKQCGFYLAIDDFGVGQASYSYLYRFSPNLLKIDGSFISGVDSDSVKQCIVRSIIQLGQELNIKTVAEKVETQQELDILLSLGIDYLQGYRLQQPTLFISSQ